MRKVLITTTPFGENDRLPLDLLEMHNIGYTTTPLGHRMSEVELSSLIGSYDAVIAGTDPITDRIMNNITSPFLISRVGVGLDNVDLNAARRRNISVSYTPHAPAPAVAELTIGLMISLLRCIHISNNQMHLRKWKRLSGRRIAGVTIGIIGVGRIGSRVAKMLMKLGATRLLVNDLLYVDGIVIPEHNLEWVDKETIYRESDVISIHTPLTRDTSNMIRAEQLLKMKPDVLIVNTSRGGIINEYDLVSVMNRGHIAGAAIDVFTQEPYSGPLADIERCLLTSHMGSMSRDCRTIMEVEAVEEVIRFLLGNELEQSVPESEYALQETPHI